MRLRLLVAAAVGALLLAATVFGGSASAWYRPGCGFGDTNHVHSGPPGHQFVPGQSGVTPGDPDGNASDNCPVTAGGK
jgi:hypothetical protein